MKQFKRSFSKLLYKGHRHIGFAISLVLIMLSITGIALNHTTELKLDQHFIKSPSLLNWYGIQASSNTKSFAINNHWLTQLEQTIYLNKQPIFSSDKPLIGAIINTDFIVAAFSNQLMLLTLEGDLIEIINRPTLERIGTQGNSIFIQSQQQLYKSSDQLLSWQKIEQTTINWSSAKALPTAMKNVLQQQSREQILDYERLILDIHSGRFFGQYGVYFIDFSGILLIFLSISGMWFWLRTFISPKRKASKR